MTTSTTLLMLPISPSPHPLYQQIVKMKRILNLYSHHQNLYKKFLEIKKEQKEPLFYRNLLPIHWHHPVNMPIHFHFHRIIHKNLKTLSHHLRRIPLIKAFLRSSWTMNNNDFNRKLKINLNQLYKNWWNENKLC